VKTVLTLPPSAPSLPFAQPVNGSGKGVRRADGTAPARYQFDRAYIDRLAAQDPVTELHFTQYFGDLLSIKLRARLRSAALIDDARQETFVRVLTTIRQRGGPDAPGALGAFVNSVCNNVLFELYRVQKRHVPLDDQEHEETPDPDATVDTQLEARQHHTQVRKTLASLPSKEKQLLQWLFFEELDKDEVCRRLNVNRNYLRVLLHRAKQRFRVAYAEG
jgi:RNA polymerase sigma-70 factor (ECF subfamily)